MAEYQYYEKMQADLYRITQEKNMETRKRTALSIYVVYCIVLLSIYVIVLQYMRFFEIKYHDTALVNAAALIFFGVFLYDMLRRMHFPMAWFGFNLYRWKFYLFEAIVYSILFCILITGIKWVLITQISVFHGIPLFDLDARFAKGLFEMNKIWNHIFYILFYVFFVPLQVFIVHSAAQSPIIDFVPSRRAAFFSIIVATLFFASIHASMDISYSLGVILPGLFWTTLYVRQRSLLGVLFSHVLVGLWGLFVLGYGRFFAEFGKLVMR